MRVLFIHGFLLLLSMCAVSKADNNVKGSSKPDSKKKDALPPCQACRMLANSFKKVCHSKNKSLLSSRKIKIFFFILKKKKYV